MLKVFPEVRKIEIWGKDLREFDFSKATVQEISFHNITFKGKTVLPVSLKCLSFKGCQNIINVCCKRVTEIKFLSSINFEDYHNKWIQGIKGLKSVFFDNLSAASFMEMPSSIVKIESNNFFKYEIPFAIAEIKAALPRLVIVNDKVPISLAEGLKLRSFTPYMKNAEEDVRYSLRPREITITDSNAEELFDHPELFEKVTSLYINSSEFNLDHLNDGIKRIKLEQVNFESKTVNRLKETC